MEPGNQVGRRVFRVHEEGRVDDGVVRTGWVPLDGVDSGLDEGDRGLRVAVVKGGGSWVSRR